MKSIKKTTATSWSEALDLLYADSWSSGINRFRSPFVFRGLANSKWNLATSLIRLGGPFAELERHLLRNFCKYAHGHVADRESLWFWLTFGQHHGLPTRLLDWTYSPLVALHFATCNVEHFGRDGAIWMVDYGALNMQAPALLSEALKKEGSHVFTTEMLTRFEEPEGVVKVKFWVIDTEQKVGGIKTVSTLADFDSLSKKDFLIFFEPPSIDERVVNQFALFSVISNSSRNVDDFLMEHPDLVRVVIIPKKLKQEIRDKLDQANINERVLFPGLDGLSNWLRRHYSSFSTGLC